MIFIRYVPHTGFGNGDIEHEGNLPLPSVHLQVGRMIKFSVFFEADLNFMD